MNDRSRGALEARLETEVDSMVAKSSDLFSAVVGVATRDETFSWLGAAGASDLSGIPMSGDSPFFIASVTKLYTAAATFLLAERGLLSLQDPLGRHLPGSLVEGLHRFRGRDYSDQLTVSHLLSHTSGLADYFEGRRRGGRSIYDRVIAGEDLSWDVEQAVAISRQLGARFPPDGRKAHYSDTNFQLLGAVLEEVTEKSLDQIYDDLIFAPLGLSGTWLHGRGPVAPVVSPATVYYRRSPLILDRAMASFGPDGGLVSTVPDLLRFLRAFFEGELLSEPSLEAATGIWRRIFFPLQYGSGVMRFQIPWFLSPFGSQPELVGHSGASGSFAFHCELGGSYVVGTFNQVANPSRSFRFLLKIASLVAQRR